MGLAKWTPHVVLGSELDEKQGYCGLPLEVAQGYFILPFPGSAGESLPTEGHTFEVAC